MKRISFVTILVLFLTLFLSSCGPPPETGEISFKVPTVSDKGFATFHDPDEQGILSISVSIFSSFQDPKEAQIYVDNTGPYICWLQPGIINPCNNVELKGTGVHVLRAEVYKLNGEVVSTEISVDWTPYSPLDLTMIKIAGLVGSQDPRWGFNLVGALFAGILAIVIVRSKAGKWGAIVLFIVAAFSFAAFAPEGVSAIVIRGLYGAISGYFFIIIIKIITDRYRHFAHMKVDPDGGFSGTYLGDGTPGGAAVMREMGRVGQQALAAQRRRDYLPDGYDEYEQLPGDHVTPRQLPRGSRGRASDEIIDLDEFVESDSNPVARKLFKRR